MTESEAVAIVVEGLAGPDSLAMKVARREGFDEDLFTRVKGALVFLVVAWRGRTDVPKGLAYAFVDIQTTMQLGWASYSPEEQERIEDAANELVDLAYHLFAVPGVV